LNQKEQIVLIVVIIAAIAGGITFLMWSTMMDNNMDKALRGDLVLPYAYGQNFEPLCLQNGAVLNKDENIVIIDMTVADNTKCIFNYAREGYEIKAITGTTMFMQKDIVK